MSPLIFEPLDRRWLHLFGYQLALPREQDGVYYSGCMAALQGVGSYICNLTAVLIEVVDYGLPGQSAWQGWIQPFGTYLSRTY